MTHLAERPLAKADAPVGVNELAAFKRNGFEAINFQAQNDTTTRAFDLKPAKDAGLDAGVWGVTYRVEEFFRDGKRLAELALEMQAGHLTADIEFALKGTRAERKARAYVDGVRAGGWTGPVHLNTLAAPDNHLVNDFEFDLESFLETGGGVFAQCYFNMHFGYHPKNAREYFVERMGVPADRFNATISLAHSESSAPRPQVRISGEEWVPILQEGGIGKNLSIFLAGSVQGDPDGPGPLKGDLEGLSVLTLAPDTQPVPAPAPAPTPKTLIQYRDEALAILEEAARVHGAAVTQTTRVNHMTRVGSTTDAKRKLVDPALDKISV